MKRRTSGWRGLARALMAAWPSLVLAAALPSAANAQDLGVGLNRSITFVIFALSDDGSTVVPNVEITGIAEIPNAPHGGHRSGHQPQRNPEFMGEVSPSSCNTGPNAHGCVVTFTSRNIGGQVKFFVRAIQNGQERTFETPNGINIGHFDGAEMGTYIGRSPAFALLGDTPQHPDNHYCAEDFCNNLVSLAEDYNVTWGLILGYNDGSLIRGGIFDIAFNWVPDHREHQTGRSQDVRSNGGEYSIPYDNTIRQWFENWCIQRFGRRPEIHGTGSNVHYHIYG
jgi:hypothetical protein